MKKMLALVALLGLGIMVGCGDEPKKTGTTKSTVVAPAKTADAAPPAAGTGDKKAP